MKSRLLLLALSLLVALASVADTEFSPERRIGPAAFPQTAPDVAAHGSDFLAAWTTEPRAPESFGSSVWIAKIDANGNLAANVATPLDPGSTNPEGISLSDGRDGWFASWYSYAQLNVALVDSSGAVAHTTRVPLGDSFNGTRTHTVWNGAVHLVVCQSYTLLAALFDNDGNVIQAPVSIGSPFAEIAVLSDTNGFLIVSSHEAGGVYTIYGRRMSSSGVLGDWFLIRGDGPRIEGLAATSDGARDIVAWGDTSGVFVMEVGGATAQLTHSEAAVSDVLVSNGRVWIAFRDANGSAYMTIAPDQFVTSPVAAPAGDLPHLATNGASMLLVGLRVIADSDVFAGFITPAAAGEGFLVSRTVTDQANGWIARDLFVWDEQIGAHRQVFAGGFDPAGKQLSSEGENTNPVAAFNGSEYLVVWLSRGDDPTTARVLARRISAAGAVLDAQNIDIGPGIPNSRPRVASDGENWLVASIQPPTGVRFGCFLYSGYEIALHRVTPEGFVLDGDGVAMPGNGGMGQVDVDLGWTGSRYVVAWESQCTAYHAPMTTSIDAAFVSQDLSTIDPFPVTPPFVSTLGYFSPHVAAGEPSLMAWMFGTTQFRIAGDPLPARRRVFSNANPQLGRIGSALLDVRRNPNGSFSIFTTNENVLYETVVTSDGLQSAPLPRVPLPAGASFTGNIDGSRAVASIPEAGARRLWAVDVDATRFDSDSALTPTR